MFAVKCCAMLAHVGTNRMSDKAAAGRPVQTAHSTKSKMKIHLLCNIRNGLFVSYEMKMYICTTWLVVLGPGQRKYF